MVGIKIDTLELIRIAQDIRNIEKDISNNMSKINSVIKKIENTWKTNNIKEFKNKFNNLVQDAANLVTCIEAYSKFVEDATGIYEQVEQAIKKAVEEVNNVSEWK